MKLTPIKKWNSILFFTISTILISCDPSIGYEYYLNNESDKKLKITYTECGINDSSTTIIVSPNSEILFYEYSLFGGSNPHDEKDDFLIIMFDSLSIEAIDSTSLLLNYLERENWTYSRDVHRWGLIKEGTNFYKLRITNDDFVNNNSDN